MGTDGSPGTRRGLHLTSLLGISGDVPGKARSGLSSPGAEGLGIAAMRPRDSVSAEPTFVWLNLRILNLEGQKEVLSGACRRLADLTVYSCQNKPHF